MVMMPSVKAVKDQSVLTWKLVLILTLMAWISGSLLLDGIVMPCLYGAGMMTQPGFSAAGYQLFGLFNHVEMLLASVVMTGVLASETLRATAPLRGSPSVILAGILLVIALGVTYGLTPMMSGFGLEMTGEMGVAIVSQGMNQLHGVYWGLEVVKLLVSGALLRQVLQGFWLVNP